MNPNETHDGLVDKNKNQEWKRNALETVVNEPSKSMFVQQECSKESREYEESRHAKCMDGIDNRVSPICGAVRILNIPIGHVVERSMYEDPQKHQCSSEGVQSVYSLLFFHEHSVS